MDLPPLTRGQSYLLSVNPVSLFFLALARGCEIGTRATCVRVAKVERLPQFVKSMLCMTINRTLQVIFNTTTSTCTEYISAYRYLQLTEIHNNVKACRAALAKM